MKITNELRAKVYSKVFPDYPPLRFDDRWLDGMWFMGNNYKGSGYYGAYPPSYLPRISVVLPDAHPKRTLHLFSGSIPEGPYLRMDCLKEPTKGTKPEIVGDAEFLTDYFEKESLELIYADTPYSKDDAEVYGRALINRRNVFGEALDVLVKKGFLVWMDQVFPMYSKSLWTLWGVIHIIRSTNHRVRTVFIFQKR